jgi:hypothetical protein
MKIISPITCPPDFGPVEFEPRDDYRDDVFAVTVAGEEMAELAPLTLSIGEILSEEDGACPGDAKGSWSLTLTGEGERTFDTHLLFLGRDHHGDPSELSGELAVWATLALIWAHDGTVIGRG